MGPKRTANKGFAFVLSDETGKSKSEDRKMIRSHVMRGKNTRKAEPSPAAAAAWNGEGSSRELPSRALVPTRPKAVAPVADESNEATSEVAEGSSVARVQRTPHDMHMFKFADEIDDIGRSMAFEFFSVIKESMYPAEWCMQHDMSSSPWFLWLLTDKAYLHLTLATVSTIQETARGEAMSKRAKYHTWKSLKLLNQNIAEEGQDLTESTIATIVAATLLAEMFGDHKAAAAHVGALRKIVELRGGVEAFSHNLQLQVKLWRIDVAWSLLTGDRPQYFRDGLSWERAFNSILGPCPGGVKTRRGRCAVRAMLNAIDLRLSHAFSDLRDYSRMANQLFKARRIPADSFHQLMTSIEYRLLYMEFSNVDPVAEAFRLAMLAFLTTLFMQMQGFKLKFLYLADRLREMLRRIEAPEGVASDATRLVVAWTLVMADLAVFQSTEDEWLMPMLAGLQDCLGLTWPQFRESLRSIMWYNPVHDAHGLRVYERLSFYVANAAVTSSSDWLIEDLLEDQTGWGSSDFSSPESVTSTYTTAR
ncbi:hypothetical protein CSOJ01_02935 [Colletotrichum sojae]|uniref:Uncharacterized protein n=1 Tax=Colletotrichum sojae TaxID=2175907 RepID=A0A8H6JPC0_9PEZI|nr:hypothetical protein CSOJ01_02935 [Colletotrichum sojae]